jgi:hypothetical protein
MFSNIVDFIEQPDGWDGIYKFCKILNHKGPLKKETQTIRGQGIMFK